MSDFLSQKPQPIFKARDLAEKLSRPTRAIKDGIKEILSTEEGNAQANKSSRNKASKITGVFEVFKSEISETIDREEFADAFAQTLTYSLFLTKLTSPSQEDLTLGNIKSFTLKSFSLIKEILTFVDEIDDYPTLRPYLERLFSIINLTQARQVQEDLQNQKGEYEDPYIHFYENFLTAYDERRRKDLGVWYTPKPIVKSIIDNIHHILKTDFGLSQGLAHRLNHSQVKLLDFACGTGTFLLEVYEKILSQLPPNSAKRQSLIRNHILKNIFGFELLIPAYAISHLKLSQYLKDQGYAYENEDDRVKVYFTNTLESKSKAKGQLDFYENLFPAITQEGRAAQEIKDDRDILVITGNPPYNAVSKNNFTHIKELIQPYFPQDERKERNPKWLNDDYVKFIRFAENKIAHSGRGIVGIITNHSFIDNPTFRAMRQHLMKTFDKIYIIDLHGNTKKKEKSPDGSPDQNVFDIQQGVAISFFIKNDKLKEKGIYHLDVFGKRKPKLEQVATLDLSNADNTRSSFTKISPTAPFYLFLPQDEKLRAEYEKGWSLRDVFNLTNVGVVTGRDKKVIAFNEVSLEKSIKENFNNFEKKFLVNIAYRPFDDRKIYYETKTKGIIERARVDLMQHFINKENLGLVFVRNNQGVKIDHFFISNSLIHGHLLGGLAYIAPLYLYAPETGAKSPNFKKEFSEMVAQRLGQKSSNPSPEEVLGYIYACLHSPAYRKKYLEFLKIDFPRVSFDTSLEQFKRKASIGQELIAAHLLKEIPLNSISNSTSNPTLTSIGEPKFNEANEQDYTVKKVDYDPDRERLYFNKTCYFADVPPEVWQFKIGGYQVLDKYLKARKGMDISGDLEHLQNVIQVLAFTLDKMREIDREG